MALELDEQYYAQGYKFIVGCDEAGRGCLLFGKELVNVIQGDQL